MLFDEDAAAEARCTCEDNTEMDLNLLKPTVFAMHQQF